MQIALHYPDAVAPPYGVWWLDEQSATVHSHYLPEAQGAGEALAPLAGATTVQQWHAATERLQRPSGTDRLRTTASTVISPLDFFYSTIRHWALTW
jgi:hypothetical protein